VSFPVVTAKLPVIFASVRFIDVVNIVMLVIKDVSFLQSRARLERLACVTVAFT
jgi:hypothetical protein